MQLTFSMVEPNPRALLSKSQASRVRLRSAREGEGRFLPAIERSAGQLFSQIEGLSWLADAEDLPASFHERLIEAGTCWVAESETGDIIGFLTAETVADSLHVWEFSIARQWQCQGIGRKLFEHVIGEARQRGSSSVTLTTFCDVPWNAPFYAQLGFRAVSEPDGRLGAIVRKEGLTGFLPGSRCAMKLDLATPQSGTGSRDECASPSFAAGTVSRRSFTAAVGGLAATVLARPSVAASRRASVAASRRAIKGIAFDAFTVFDAKHVMEVAERHFGDAGRPLVGAWTNKLFSLSWLVTAADNYRDFLTISGAALQSVADGMKIGLPDGARRELVDSFAELSVWPDVEPVLERLRGAGIRLRFLSNLGEAALRSNMQKGGIAHYFEDPLSTDLVRRFKPSPRAYHMAQDAFGLALDQIGFVAFASWDALGATWFGYRTAWINRGMAPAERLEPAPAITSGSFEGVLRLAGV